MSVLAILVAALLQPATVAIGKTQKALPLHDPGMLPMLLYFHSDECNGCASFDKLFEEPEILRRIEEHYITVRINIDDLDGRACAEIYHVTNAPALVVAHHTGEVLFKSDANLTDADIRLLLEELPVRFTGVPVPATNDEQINVEIVKPVPAIQIESVESQYAGHEFSKQATLMGGNVQALNSPLPLETSTNALSTTLPEVSTPAPGMIPAHSENDHKPATEDESTMSADGPSEQRWTYSIQLGFFSDEQNAQAYQHKAELAGIKEIRTVEEQRKENTFYRILIGQYPTLRDAQKILDEVHALGFKGAVYRY